MKVIRFKEDKWYTNTLYKISKFLLFLGRKYLFKVFIERVMVDGHIMFTERWVTQRELDVATKRANDLLKNIKWD